MRDTAVIRRSSGITLERAQTALLDIDDVGRLGKNMRDWIQQVGRDVNPSTANTGAIIGNM